MEAFEVLCITWKIYKGVKNIIGINIILSENVFKAAQWGNISTHYTRKAGATRQYCHSHLGFHHILSAVAAWVSAINGKAINNCNSKKNTCIRTLVDLLIKLFSMYISEQLYALQEIDFFSDTFNISASSAFFPLSTQRRPYTTAWCPLILCIGLRASNYFDILLWNPWVNSANIHEYSLYARMRLCVPTSKQTSVQYHY